MDYTPGVRSVIRPAISPDGPTAARRRPIYGRRVRRGPRSRAARAQSAGIWAWMRAGRMSSMTQYLETTSRSSSSVTAFIGPSRHAPPCRRPVRSTTRPARRRARWTVGSPRAARRASSGKRLSTIVSNRPSYPVKMLMSATAKLALVRPRRCASAVASSMAVGEASRPTVVCPRRPGPARWHLPRSPRRERRRETCPVR